MVPEPDNICSGSLGPPNPGAGRCSAVWQGHALARCTSTADPRAMPMPGRRRCRSLRVEPDGSRVVWAGAPASSRDRSRQAGGVTPKPGRYQPAASGETPQKKMLKCRDIRISCLESEKVVFTRTPGRHSSRSKASGQVRRQFVAGQVIDHLVHRDGLRDDHSAVPEPGKIVFVDRNARLGTRQ